MQILIKYSNKIYYYLLILIAITLFIPMKISNIAVVLLLVNWLLGLNYKEKISKAFSNLFFWLFIGIYIISIIGLAYTTNTKHGMFSLEKQLSLLLFPLIISSSPALERKQLNKIIICYIITSVVAILFTFSYAVHRATIVPEGYYKLNIFTNEITFIMGTSHVYYGLYLVLSALYCIYLFYNTTKFTLRCLLVVAYIIIFAYTVLITAKIALISLVILSVVLLIYLKRFFKIYSLIVFIVLIVVSIQLWNYIPKIKERFSDITLSSGSFYSSQRIATLNCSSELIKENWLLGVGTGDDYDLLNNCYEQMGQQKFEGLDTHNQYFDFLLTFGIGGLLVFLTSLLVPLYNAIKEKQILYILFLLHFMICCLTENLLDNNKGIVFFAFFNSLFAFNL